MLNSVSLARVDLNLLVLFEVVFEERHVGRAAARLSLTPSAVSHGLGRLRRLFNDPVFLRTPKGVVPTARAAELAAPIADILAGARRVIGSGDPFDPETSRRRFTIGAPDGASAVFLPPLLERLRSVASGVDVSLRQLLPVPGEASPEQAWRNAFADLDANALDIAVIPTEHAPARFQPGRLYEEDFVIAARRLHPFVRDPSLDRYCAERHLVVSFTGDRDGFVDQALAKLGRARRVALTVPDFVFALAVIADSDLVSALPRRLVAMHGPRFGIVAVEPPLRLPRFRMTALAPKVAMMDAGLAWLFDLLGAVGLGAPPAKQRLSRRGRTP